MTRTAAFAMRLWACGLRVAEIAAAMRWTCPETVNVLRRYGALR